MAAGGRQIGLEGIEELLGLLLSSWYLAREVVLCAGDDTVAISKKIKNFR